MGASVALAGASGCTVQPKEVIVPYVRQPEEVVPGNPLFYATAMSTAGIATGLLVESHMGRPTKVEGNPQHPASLGATDAAMQASILTLYDPDRSQTVTRNGAINDWGNFLTALTGARDSAGLETGLRPSAFLTGTVTSPTLASQIEGVPNCLSSSEVASIRPLRSSLRASRRHDGFREARQYDLSV